MRTDALLLVRDATVSYNGRPAVENVSFSVAPGENLCIVGPNGSGKSTLLMGILGLKPLDRGAATLAHGPNSVAYLAQMHTTERDFPATAWEIVLSGTQISGKRLPFYTKTDKERAREAMALLKIEGLARSRIGRLSGGQQQRVLIARAIARRPELLVMDEPCSALDPAITEELYELFARLKRDMRLAMLLSTHDWRYVAREADTVLELNRTVDFYGTAADWRARKGGPEIG